MLIVRKLRSVGAEELELRVISGIRCAIQYRLSLIIA